MECRVPTWIATWSRNAECKRGLEHGSGIWNMNVTVNLDWECRVQTVWSSHTQFKAASL